MRNASIAQKLMRNAIGGTISYKMLKSSSIYQVSGYQNYWYMIVILFKKYFNRFKVSTSS